MVIDANTGALRWQPTVGQIGTHTIKVRATDSVGAYTGQEYTLKVNGINTPPQIQSSPNTKAGIDSADRYQVVATDLEGDALTYQLGRAPNGMTIDRSGLVAWTPTSSQIGTQSVDILVTGLIAWDNPTLGNYQIVVKVADNAGNTVTQGYTLTAKTNHAPTISSTPKDKVTLGNTYRYDVVAKDIDNDALTYSIDTVARAAGVSIDTYGRISWKPTNIGTQPITITVTDALGAKVEQVYNLQVLADNTAPTISLLGSTNRTNVGDTVYFQVNATDDVGVKTTQLLVNNQAVTLDGNGVGSYIVTTPGVVTAVAIATDTSGNSSTTSTTVNVIDPNDNQAPTVSLNLSGILNGIVTGRTDIKGTATDTNLDYYTVEVARMGTNSFKEVWRGTNNVNDGVLGKFDPSQLENDTYTIRLTAYDTNGHVSSVEDEIEVTGELKLGNFKLSFTDLSIPVNGIPINLTRTYDSLTAGTTDDFGYGWRMEFRDTDLRTNLKPDPYYEELGYRTEGFKAGTRVYVTLPGGKREGFTFQPQYVQGALGGLTGGRLLYPSFVADKGVTSTLSVPGAEIKANTNGDSANAGNVSGNANGILIERNGKLFNLAGRPYVPQDDGFGNRYLLTTKDGVRYEINATSGDLESVTDPNGNKLTYKAYEIYSSTGQKISFERDAQGRITSVTDPMGKQVKYEYDSQG